MKHLHLSFCRKRHWMCFDVHTVENLSLWRSCDVHSWRIIYLFFLSVCLSVCLAVGRWVQFQQRRGSRGRCVQSDLSDPVQEWGGDPGGPHELQSAPAAGRGESECPAALTTEETNTCEAIAVKGVGCQPEGYRFKSPRKNEYELK